MFNKIVQLWNIAGNTKGGIRYLFAKHSSLSSFQICSNIFDVDETIKSCFDVGANIGQFAGAFRKYYPEAQIFSFEPNPDTFQKLKHNFRHDAKQQSFNFGLAHTDSTLDFFANEYSHASSFLDVSEHQKKLIPKTRNVKKITVPVKRLDGLEFTKSIARPSLLKLDVQGFEKNVLLGSEGILSTVDYILIETSFFNMYENEPLFDEMHTFMKSQRFNIFMPVGYLLDKKNRIIQMDVLYKNENINK